MPPRPHAPATGSPEGKRGFAILIVESSPPFRAYLKSALLNIFPWVAISTADSVREALLRIEAAPPDLILMGVHLRDGQGFELTRTLRRMSVRARVAFLSGYDLPEYRDEAYRSGADHFLSKGTLRLEEVAALVRAAVSAAGSAA
jgi:DNA-binding NarL/FixJ family response regulator